MLSSPQQRFLLFYAVTLLPFRVLRSRHFQRNQPTATSNEWADVKHVCMLPTKADGAIDISEPAIAFSSPHRVARIKDQMQCRGGKRSGGSYCAVSYPMYGGSSQPSQIRPLGCASIIDGSPALNDFVIMATDLYNDARLRYPVMCELWRLAYRQR